MARRMPSAEGSLLVHPAISLSIVFIWIAASIAILASICASCHRKAATSSPKASSSQAANGSVGKGEADDEDQEVEGTPLPKDRITELDAAIHGPIYPTSNLPAGSTSKRRLSLSLSTGLKEGLSRIKTKK